MLRCRSHRLSIAVMPAWIVLAAGCNSYSVPLPPVAPSVNSPSTGSGSSFVGAAPASPSSQFTVNPAGFSFPNTVIGTTSSIDAVLTLTSNAGNAPIQLTDIRSSNPSEFPVTTTCSVPGALAPDTTCLVTIQFKPNSAGTRSAQITMITANAGRVSVTMSGAGVQLILPVITISPESFVFPGTLVGSTSFTGAVFTLTGGTTLIGLTDITSSNPGEFPMTTTCNLPGSLTPGASCTIAVQFRPIAGGSRSAQLTILTNAGTRTLSVSGPGI